MKQSVILFMLLCLAPALYAEDWYKERKEVECAERLGFSLGLQSHFTRCDYVSDRFGALSLGACWQTKRRHYFGMDVAFSSARAHEDFHTGEGWIYDDERLMYNELLFSYGRVVKESCYYTLLPFVAMGAEGYGIPGEEDEYKFLPWKNGFIVGMGLCYDWRFKYCKISTHGIRVKPYFTLARYAAPFKWVPSFNLSLTYILGVNY